MKNLGRNGAKYKSAKWPAAVRGHHNQIGLFIFRIANDLLSGIADRNMSLYFSPVNSSTRN